MNRSASQTKRPIRMLQFGEGNFLRAFVDWMVDISNQQGITDIGIAIVTPRFRNNATAQKLREQDCLYNVILEGIEHGKPKRELRLVSSVSEVITPETEMEKYINLVESDDLQVIVSNTTEAGISYADDDATKADASTFPAKIAWLLHHRWEHFNGSADKGLVIICCELIEDNGAKLKEYVIKHSKKAGFEPEFFDWIENACAFCDSLVDRIVAGFPADCKDALKAEIGYEDALMVKGELYHLWVIGGKDVEKARKILPLDKAGLNVHFMPEVNSFRDRKVRILNGAHTAMTPIALQIGCETVLDAFSNDDVNTFLSSMISDEVLPLIEGDKEEIRKFADGILERFYNPYIKHFLKSISLNSLSKWHARNWPTAKDYYKKFGKIADHQAFSLAALLSLYLYDEKFMPQDDEKSLAAMRQIFTENEDTKVAIKRLFESIVFGENYETQTPGFAKRTAHYLRLILESGMEKAIKTINSGKID